MQLGYKVPRLEVHFWDGSIVHGTAGQKMGDRKAFVKIQSLGKCGYFVPKLNSFVFRLTWVCVPVFPPI